MRRFIKPDATDENWEHFGKKCPYYGVVSWQEFRPENFNAEAKVKFFQTVEQYIQKLFEVIRSKVQLDFRPVQALDFGCGVGRLLIPLAKRCKKATGIDVSPSMRAESEKNCLQTGIDNFSLAASAETLITQGIKFDFINSFIVFQHIPPKRGYLILENYFNSWMTMALARFISLIRIHLVSAVGLPVGVIENFHCSTECQTFFIGARFPNR